MARYLARLNRGPCEHDTDNPFSRPVEIEQRCIGATMDWGARIVPEFEWHLTCKICGHKWRSTGILPMRILMEVGDGPKFFPNGIDQWPVDPVTGERLPIAPGSRL